MHAWHGMATHAMHACAAQGEACRVCACTSQGGAFHAVHAPPPPRSNAMQLLPLLACCQRAAGFLFDTLLLPLLAAVQAERVAQAGNVVEVLHSLWAALSVGADAPEQALIRKMMAGPNVLHARTLDKVRGRGVRACVGWCALPHAGLGVCTRTRYVAGLQGAVLAVLVRP